MIRMMKVIQVSTTDKGDLSYDKGDEGDSS
jgi:hypothetical protein